MHALKSLPEFHFLFHNNNFLVWLYDGNVPLSFASISHDELHGSVRNKYGCFEGAKRVGEWEIIANRCEVANTRIGSPGPNPPAHPNSSTLVTNVHEFNISSCIQQVRKPIYAHWSENVSSELALKPSSSKIPCPPNGIVGTSLVLSC